MPQPPRAGELWLQPAPELMEPLLARLCLQHSRVKNVDLQSFTTRRIWHHAGWEDEALIIGLLDSSLWDSKAASFTLQLLEVQRTTRRVRNPASQWQMEGTQPFTLEDNLTTQRKAVTHQASNELKLCQQREGERPGSL